MIVTPLQKNSAKREVRNKQMLKILVFLYLCFMTVKELQQQYADNLKIRPMEQRKKNELNHVYLSHVRSQVIIISKMVGIKNGEAYLQQALRNWPEVLEQELEKIEKA